MNTSTLKTSAPQPFPIRIFFVLVLGALGLALGGAILSKANSDISDLENNSQEFEKGLQPLQKFKQENNISLGCLKSPDHLTAWDFQMSPQVQAQLSLQQKNKIEALQQYRQAVDQLATTGQKLVAAEEDLVHTRWPDGIPWWVKLIPWQRSRFLKLRDNIDARIAWAKRELSDTSCQN
jgi:hypothetical protein